MRGEFSPRPWGWSVTRYASATDGFVFPTPVGMVRIVHLALINQHRFPHARGDGPGRDYRAAREGLFSPRPWGWSAPPMYSALT